MCVRAGVRAEGTGEPKEVELSDERPGILERARRAFECRLLRRVAE